MARPYIFQELAEKGRAAGFGTPQESRRARTWYSNTAKRIRSVNINRIMEGTPSRHQGRLTPGDIGHMFCFWYDAKHKDTLPYWDQFPLILPFHVDDDHIKGFNLHYIAPYRRAMVLNALYKLSGDRDRRMAAAAGRMTEAPPMDDRDRRLSVSYGMLGAASKLSWLKPCVKMYLRNHVKSRFFWIHPDEWDMAVQLPLARFVGASPMKVARESAKRFRT